MSMMQNLIILCYKYGEEVVFFFLDGKVVVVIDYVYLYKMYIESFIYFEVVVDQFLRLIEMVRDVIEIL